MSKFYAYQSQELELKIAPAQPTSTSLTARGTLPTRVPSEKVTGPPARRKMVEPLPQPRRYFAHLDEPTPAMVRLVHDADHSQQLHSRISQRKGGH